MYRISQMAPRGTDTKPVYMVRHYVDDDPIPTVGTEKEFASLPDAITYALGKAAKMSLIATGYPDATVVEDIHGRRFRVTVEAL
jgi:hypothetical protein